MPSRTTVSVGVAAALLAGLAVGLAARRRAARTREEPAPAPTHIELPDRPPAAVEDAIAEGVVAAEQLAPEPAAAGS